MYLSSFPLQQMSIIPRSGEDKGAVRAKMDFMKFATSSFRYTNCQYEVDTILYFLK